MPAVPALPPEALPLVLALAGLAAGALLAALVAWLLARHGRRLRAEAEAARSASEGTLREAFQSLSVDVLHKNSQIFLEQARASLGEYQKGASSTTRRSWSSPQRPREGALRIARTRVAVSFESFEWSALTWRSCWVREL